MEAAAKAPARKRKMICAAKLGDSAVAMIQMRYNKNVLRYVVSLPKVSLMGPVSTALAPTPNRYMEVARDSAIGETWKSLSAISCAVESAEDAHPVTKTNSQMMLVTKSLYDRDQFRGLWASLASKSTVFVASLSACEAIPSVTSCCSRRYCR